MTTMGAIPNGDADGFGEGIIRIENVYLTTAGSIHQRDTAEAVPKKNTSLLKVLSKQTQLFKISILKTFHPNLMHKTS